MSLSHAEDRYRYDPAFHSLVDALAARLADGTHTVTDIQAAVLLAQDLAQRVTVDADTTIQSGHARVAVAQALGATHIPVAREEDPTLLPMSRHDQVRRDRAVACDRNDLESLNEAIRGLQSTEHPSLVPLHDELQHRYAALMQAQRRRARDADA